MNNAKNCDSLAIGLSVLHIYFDSSTKLFFWSVSSYNFRFFSKTVLSVEIDGSTMVNECMKRCAHNNPFTITDS